MRIAHIFNPVLVPPDSDLGIAQPLTFETMRLARDAAAGMVAVDLLTAQYAEDRGAVPAGFCATPDLERSLLDFGTFVKPRKLPLIGDIVERLYAASDADYFLYTNIAIALMPFFYVAVAAMLRQGHDALVINLAATANNFREYEDQHLTFHLGDDRTWERHDQDDSRAFNRGELVQVDNTIRTRGDLPTHPAVTSFLEHWGRTNSANIA